MTTTNGKMRFWHGALPRAPFLDHVASRHHLFYCAWLLVGWAVILNGCGGSEGPNITGRYQLSAIAGTTTQNCTDEFVAFIVALNQALGGTAGAPTEGIVNIEKATENALTLTLEGGTGVSLTLSEATASNAAAGWEYQGAISAVLTASGCSIAENVTLLLASSANDHIEIFLADEYAVTPLTSSCPFVAGTCTFLQTNAEGVPL